MREALPFAELPGATALNKRAGQVASPRARKHPRSAIRARSVGNPGARRGGGAVPSPCRVLPPPRPPRPPESSRIPAFHVAAAAASPAQAVPTLSSGWCRRPRPFQGLGSARRGRRPSALGSWARAGAGRGGERARARGRGGAGRHIGLASAASVRLRAAGTGAPRGAQGAGARGQGRRGRGGRERKGVAASRAAAASALLPAHQSLLRRLGRLPARRGKMPSTQGCEEGAEVAAGAVRAAAAAAAVRVL